MFTGLVVNDKNSALSTILSRVKSMLRDELIFNQFNQISISFHFFPDDWDHASSGSPKQSGSLSDLRFSWKSQKVPAGSSKRAIDITVGALALVLCSPLFLAIALAIKMSSKGPVLFPAKTGCGSTASPSHF